MQLQNIDDLGIIVTEEGEIFLSDNGIKKQLKQYYAGKCKRGHYKAVCFYKNKKRYMYYVHRLVASVYVPNPHNKPYVNHKDGNPENNNYLNLEWVTNSENLSHAYKELNERKKCPICGKEKYKESICKTCYERNKYRKKSMERKQIKKQQFLENIKNIDYYKLNDKQKDFLQMRLNGYTLKQIGDKYSISKQAVSVALDKILKNSYCGKGIVKNE